MIKGALIVCLLGTSNVDCTSGGTWAYKITGPYAFETVRECRDVMLKITHDAGMDVKSESVNHKKVYYLIECGMDRL